MLLSWLALFLGACAAVYPEMSTSVREPSPGTPLDPPPPDDLYYIAFDGAVVPDHTRDGRAWGGSGPATYAKFKVGDRDLIVTPVEPGNRKPSWPDQRRANYRLQHSDDLFVELWATGVADVPLCALRVRDIEHLRGGGNAEFSCDSGARLFLRVEPARAVVGLGLFYELRGSDGVKVTRVQGQSPAARAGLRAGDRILSIQGQPVAKLDALGVRGKINRDARAGVTLDILRESGERAEITIAEGPIYPLLRDGIELPRNP